MIKHIYIGDFTFVEPNQKDYNELKEKHNLCNFDIFKDNPKFVIVHNIEIVKEYNEETLNEIEEKGLSYLIPDEYLGLVIYDIL